MSALSCSSAKTPELNIPLHGLTTATGGACAECSGKDLCNSAKKITMSFASLVMVVLLVAGKNIF